MVQAGHTKAGASVALATAFLETSWFSLTGCRSMVEPPLDEGYPDKGQYSTHPEARLLIFS